MLEIKDISTCYGKVQVLNNISLKINEGTIDIIIGSNGAGKTTLLRAISGLIRTVGGKIIFDGGDITNSPPHKIASLGIIQVPQGRRMFGDLNVFDNLLLGAHARRKRGGRGKNISAEITLLFEQFPILCRKRNQLAGTLSGGEQQILAIGRALMGDPRIMMLDEPSLGLGPIIIKEVYEIIKHLNSEGKTILLVEQLANLALKIGGNGYVLEHGRIVLEGVCEELKRNRKLEETYLKA